MKTKENTINNIGSYIDFLYIRARSLIKNNECQVDDLVQDTLYTAFKKKDKFKDGTNLKAWLSIIMKNIFINKVRIKNPLYNWKDKYILNEHISDTYSEIDYNTKYFEYNQSRKEFLTYINKLPKNQKDLVIMHYYNNMKYLEICKKLDMPLHTVKNKLYAARQTLREMILLN